MTLAERIKEVRRWSGLTQTQFADRIGLTMSSISQTERGIINPTKQTLALICKEFNVNKVWLETGEGDMSLPSTDPIAEIVSDVLENGQDNPFYKSILKAVKLYQSLSLRDREYIDDLIDRLIEEQKNDPE